MSACVSKIDHSWVNLQFANDAHSNQIINTTTTKNRARK